jgi:beta-N-acetylhexosaminidase
MLFSTDVQAQDSLDIMIGQMLMVGFPPDTDFRDTLNIDIAERHLGGVVLFEYHIQNPVQLMHLTGQLYSKSSLPFFIATDQEGGRVARFNAKNGYDSTYSAFQLGTEFDSEDSTRQQAALMAGWLYEAGINIVLAPVVDLNTNPSSPAIGAFDRSFSQNPETVIRHTEWFISEFSNKNVLTCLKHFPGHGSAIEDSHNNLTDISSTWIESELKPYQFFIQQGFDDIIMVSHLVNQKIDPVLPASLSYLAVTKLLRDSLGFEGVVITDDLFMESISKEYALEDVVEQSINAGVDILVFRTNEFEKCSLVRKVIELIMVKIAKGEIPVCRIKNAYYRIMALKNKIIEYGILTPRGLPDLFHVYTRKDLRSGNPDLIIETGRDAPVLLQILNREGKILIEKSWSLLSAGNHKLKLTDNFSSGIYIYRMKMYDFEFNGKFFWLNEPK